MQAHAGRLGQSPPLCLTDQAREPRDLALGHQRLAGQDDVGGDRQPLQQRGMVARLDPVEGDAESRAHEGLGLEVVADLPQVMAELVQDGP